jgi:hypothetical protein
MKNVVGIETTPVETNPQDAVVESMNEFLATPEGQIAYVSSIVLDPSGAVDTENTALNLNTAFMNRQAEEAQLIQTKRQMEQAQGDVAVWKSQTELAMADYLPAWQQESEAFITSLAALVSNGDERYDSWDEQMGALREYERVTRNSFRSRALSAGMNSEVFESQIGQAIAPITEAINMMEKFTGDQKTFLDLMKNTAEADVTTGFIEMFGSLGGLPEFQNEAARIAANQRLYDGGEWTKLFEYFKTAAASGIQSPLDLFSNIPSSVPEAMTSESLSNPDLVTEMRSKGEDFVYDTLDTAGGALTTMPLQNLGTPEGQQAILGHIGMIVNGADAVANPLSISELQKVFTPNSVRVIASVAGMGTQAGVDVRGAVVGFVTSQTRRNEVQIQDAVNGMPEGVDVTYRNGQATLSVDLNTFLATEQGQSFDNYVQSVLGTLPGKMRQSELLTAMSNYSRFWGGKLTSINDNISSYNFLNQSVRRIVPEVSEMQNPDTYSETAQQPGLQPILSLLDRTEGGGDYNTLFGHSQRTGGVFAGTRISEMTIGELKQFANTSGEYGQWVKSEIGRVATPMGRYQFVGTTLFDLTQKLGIPDTAVFTPELQDAIFTYHARNVLSRRNTVEGKRSAMRAEWEGFKNVSNAELDAAIRSFETGEPLDFSNFITTQRESRVTSAPTIPSPEFLPTPSGDYSGTDLGSDEQMRQIVANASIQDGVPLDMNLKEDLSDNEREIIGYLVKTELGRLTAEGVKILQALGILQPKEGEPDA